MWVVTDKAMNSLLGGDFSNVVLTKQNCKDIPIQRLYKLQDLYLSYQGFRKFFKRHLQSIIENVCFIKDNSFVSKVIMYILGMK